MRKSIYIIREKTGCGFQNSCVMRNELSAPKSPITVLERRITKVKNWRESNLPRLFLLKRYRQDLDQVGDRLNLLRLVSFKAVLSASEFLTA